MTESTPKHTPGPWDDWPSADTDKRLGTDLIELLALKLDHEGRVATTWGDKTPQGLGATVRRVVSESAALADREERS